MAKALGISVIGLMLGVLCLISAGCRSHGNGHCASGQCGASGYSAPAYSGPTYAEPTYSDPAYGAPSGSGARTAPPQQGSGSR